MAPGQSDANSSLVGGAPRASKTHLLSQVKRCLQIFQILFMIPNQSHKHLFLN